MRMRVTWPADVRMVSFHPLSSGSGGSGVPIKYESRGSLIVGCVNGGLPFAAIQSARYLALLKFCRLTSKNWMRCTCLLCVSGVVFTNSQSSVELFVGSSVVAV